MTVHQSIAFRTAGVFFGTWLLLALAIADFPPPPGFAIVLLIGAGTLMLADYGHELIAVDRCLDAGHVYDDHKG